MHRTKICIRVAIAMAVVACRSAMPATYFVNDASTNGDTYTTAIGSDANPGTNAAAPKFSVTNLLATYTLVQGDTVFVDTGFYSNYTVSITASGVATNYIVFRGSTNGMGTVFDRRTNTADVISLEGSFVRIMDVTVRGGRRGVGFFLNSDCEMLNVHSVSNISGFYGVVASSHRFLRCVASRNTIGFENFNSANSWDYGVSWSNGTAFSPAAANTLSISNSIIVGGTAHSILPSAADYNIYWQAILGGGAKSLADIQALKGNSFRSTWVDPGLVNPVASDFHLVSPAGRYDPALQAFVTTDVTYSVAIDFGDPARAFTNEPSPRGPRVNVGTYGNSIEASKSQTSAWLFASSFNDGGQLTVSGNLCWVYGGGFAATSTATIQYSPNNGSTWSNIATGVRITNGLYTWVATGAVSSLQVQWRIASDADTNVFDVCNTNFVVRTSTSSVFSLYVNDASTVGDVYASVIGSATNSGLATNQPMNSVQGVIDTYDLGAGDTIFVDTGVYTNPVVILDDDQGSASGFLTLQGSTNYAAGETIFNIQNAGTDVILLSGASYIRLRNLSVRSGRYGLNFSVASDCLVEYVTCASNVNGVASAAAFGNNFQHCVLANNGTGLQAGNSGWVWDHGVSWSNTVAFVVSVSAISVSNSVIVGGTAFSSGISPSNSDHNVYWQTLFGGSFNTLSDLQKSTGHDLHSTVANPLFANGRGYDFHPMSEAGRYNPTSQVFVADTNTSILIDTGNPAHPFTNEPAPNGGRLNIGNFGDTPEASKSRTNAWLAALTFNDGGTLSAPGDVVYWTSGNASNLTVRIELSADSGDSWQIVQTNLAVTNGSYVWANTNFGSSVFARWRVVLESNTNVFDATDVDSTFKSGPFFYYLNDTTLNGDVYTTASGSDTNLGTSANKPKLTLQSLLETHDVEPSDVIFVDTGAYTLNGNQVITALDGGNATNHVLIRGSTNAAEGGTIFNRNLTNGAAYALHLSGAAYVDIQDIAFVNAAEGVRVESSTGITVTRSSARGCSQHGWHVINSSGISFDRSVAMTNAVVGLFIEGSQGVRVDNSVLWKNGQSGIRVDTGTILVSNSVVVASGRSAYCYYAASTTNIFGNYNDLYPENLAIVGFIASLGRNADTLSAWNGLTTQDVRSISADPLFADPDAGDFHPLTATPVGRFVLGLGYVATDPVTSPLIDSGNPAWGYSNEPPPNGGRVDIGIYGDTTEASKGRTNTWLFAATHNQAGWARGTSVLHWVAGNYSATGTVNVRVSTDGGEIWTTLTNGIRATNEALFWNTFFTSDSPACVWAVEDPSDTNVSDRTTNFFAIRNTNLLIYVNNSVTNDDVFTSTQGVSNNWRASASAPIDSLPAVFNLFDLEPGDRIFVDSGPYTNLANILVGRMDGGSSNAVVQVIGSTTGIASAVVMNRLSVAAGAHGLTVDNAGWIAASNIVFRGGGAGVVITNSHNISLSVGSQNNASNGILVYSSSRINLSRSIVANNLGPGIALRNVSEAKIGNSIVWSNSGSAILLNGGSVAVSNSVLAVGAGGAYAYDAASTADVIRADYNNVFLSTTGQVARVGSAIYKTLSRWQDAVSNDIHSLSHDPLFANPAVGDYHLQSAAGRLLPGVGLVTDAVSSLMIDAADPFVDFSAEPSPNGGRMNVGVFGNTPQESRTPTNGWLVALTLSSGGSIRGTNAIHWVAGGNATDDFVYIQYSYDEGVTWTNIATNIAASAGTVVWTTTTFITSSRGVWRIISQSDTNIADETDSLFALNNGALTYYVNDASAVGDVYTLAVGSSANDGLQPSTPKPSIEQILAAHDLGPGDQILVDTGHYLGNSTLLIGAGIAGSPTNRLVIQGSTNAAAGGTVLNRNNADPCIEVRGTEAIALRDLSITNAIRGVLLAESTNCLIESVRTEGGRTAFEIRLSPSNVIRQCTGYGFNGTGVWSAVASGLRVEDSFMYTVNRSGTCIRVDSGQISVSNSVLWADGANAAAYSLGLLASVTSDYNDVLLTNGAIAARQEKALTTRQIQQVSRLARDFGIEVHSLTHDPGFADLAGRDIHPSSLGGRYDPFTATFVTDSVSSVLIDAGNPSASYDQESAPNGSRRNIGVFGDTEQASRTSTNVFFTCVSLNDGGRAEGTNVFLYWIARGAATGLFVNLDYSPNGTANWQAIATAIPAAAGSYAWDSTSFPSSPNAAWRIRNPTNQTIVYDQTDAPFALRNQPLLFYVNDLITNGDVYVTAPGISTNQGVLPSAPMDSLQRVLDTYDLEAGDIVYIDTGTYTNNGAFLIQEIDGGDSTSRVAYVGSTNLSAGGTIFDRTGVQIYENVGIELRNITMTLSTNVGSSTGVSIERSTNVVLQNVVILNGGDGFNLEGSQNVTMDRCVAAGMKTNGLLTLNCASVVWQNGTLWSNAQGAVVVGGSATISNSVITAFGAGRFCLYVSSPGYKSDHNDIYVANGALVALLDDPSELELVVYDSVSRWSRDTGFDRYSLSHWPDFIDPGAGDFHPRSEAGRFVPSSGTFVTDLVTSPLIDAGNPAESYSSELLPNGSRINMGLHGNSPEASKTPTNPALIVVSLNDGGRADGTNTLLYWIARGAATSELVRLEASPDGGLTWQVIASNVPASAGSYSWNTTSFTTTVLALWRITAQSSTNIADMSDEIFSVRNTPMSFFVNDLSTNGDVYCLAAGNATNSGLTSSAPLPTLPLVLSTYDLEAGDTVFMDTGLYSSQVATVIGQLDSAGIATAALVTIQGSTNMVAGGTIVNGGGAAYALQLDTAIGVSLRNLIIRNAATAIGVTKSHNSSFDWIDAKTATRGIEIMNTVDVTMRNCVVRESQNEGVFASSSSRLQWLNGILWSNNLYGIRVLASSMAVSNSVIAMFGTNAFAYRIASGSVIGDYNDIYLGNGALAVFQDANPDPIIYESVSRWARDETQEVHSLTHDPGFHDPAAGDFHLRSTAGRFVVTSGTFVVTDTNTSLLIDAADPQAAMTNEPSPNGSRLNIGLYGNTVQASLSPTTGTLSVVSLNDGGRAEGANVLLYWVAGGVATGHALTLQYSADAGATWQRIATNVPATNRFYVWNSLFFTSSVQSLWQLYSETDTNIADRSDKLFALRNTPLSFYVNDSLTAGDVYTLAGGISTNLGIIPAMPNDSIQNVLDRWDIEPGDTIYIDTGTYALPNPVTVSRFDGGLRTNAAAGKVTIRGSTNQAFGGSVFVVSPPKSKKGVVLDEANGITLTDLTIRDASVGFEANGSDYVFLQYVRAERCGDGLQVDDANPVEFRNCSALNCADRGLISIGALSRTIWQNGLLWSNVQGAAADGGSIDVRNSIIGSFGPGSFAFVFRTTANASSDYNNVVLQNGAFAGAIVTPGGFLGGTSRHETVAAWVESTARDVNTLTFSPDFVDPGLGDYHLASAGGRYDPFLNAVVTDSVSSLLIDSGDPASDFAGEPELNGGRINIDPYGGTWQATRTPTNGWLSIISLNDGGDVSGTNVTLRFYAGWTATGDLVYADYSPDNGATWTNIFTNHPASSNVYIWNSTNFPRSATARWRIIDQFDASISDTNDASFVLRTGGTIPYYVNDDSLIGDVYCTAVGNDLNSGLYPTSPVRNISQILFTNRLQPRDFVFVDTGIYPLTNSIIVGEQDSGKGTNEVVEIDGVLYPARVTIIGSTNIGAGGSVINGQGLQVPAFTLQGARSVEIRNFKVINAGVGVAIDGSVECLVDSVRAEGNRLGFRVSQGSSNILISHSIARNSLSNGLLNDKASVVWENGVIWDNPNTIILDGGRSTFRNSAFNAAGSSGRVFRLTESAVLTNCDYNNIVCQSGALLAERDMAQGGNEVYSDLNGWTIAEGQDANSLAHQPLFADEGNGDFHPKSGTGRYVPGVGFTNDAEYSPMIDLGDPTVVVTNELAPNGGLVNIGAYGNTVEASLSQTNPWLLAKSLNDGGVVSDAGTLRWAYGNMPGTSLVSLSVSVDGGVEYEPLASNIPVSAKSFAWLPCSFPLTSIAKWRITSQTHTNLSDETDSTFVIKCDALTIYVNDGSLTGDIFCAAVGSPTNSGLLPSEPLLDPGEAFTRYYLSAGDTIYIDTGQYFINSVETGMILGVANRGTPTAPIVIHGSTNEAAGGTVIDRSSPASGIGLQLSQTRYVEVDHIKIKGASIGVQVSDSRHCRFEWVECYSNASSGFSISATPGVTALHCTAWNNGRYGLALGANSSVTFENGILWSNVSGAVQVSGSTLNLSNSVLHSANASSFWYTVDNAANLRSDFNFLFKPASNLLALNTFNNFKFINLKKWQDFSLSDVHSVMEDPLLADPLGGGFHLRSQAGRYLGGVFVQDTNTSWAIDAGGFSSPYAVEPLPNGSRHNVGLHGNTLQASLSTSVTGTPELLAVSLNDGGTVEGNVELYWLYRGMPETNRVRLEVSLDDGASWRIITTNLSVSAQGYEWANTNPASPSVRWRVVSESNTNLFDATDTNFYLRVGPINYYVNDTSTVGDVYTLVPGSPFNTGLSNGVPLDSVQAVLDKYDVSKGDVIYVDTGVYTSGVIVSAGDFGVATQRITIVGSTNYVAGGSVIRLADSASNAPAGVAAIRLEFTEGIEVRDFIIENADIGVDLDRCNFSKLIDLLVKSCRSAGVGFSTSSGNLLERVAVTRVEGVGVNSHLSGNTIASCVIWSNASHAVNLTSSAMEISNSVMSAHGEGNVCLVILTNSYVSGDYNCYALSSGGLYAVISGIPIEGLPQLTAEGGTTQDVHSLAVDPLFADPANDDFHLRSQAGRFDPAIQAYVFTDAVTSLLIDTGDPLATHTNEPAPNGERKNIGLYGNTSQASKSTTNSWLLAITASAGGNVEGDVYLAWAWGGAGIAATNEVLFDYSFNNGITWTNIGTAQVSSISYLWQSALKEAVTNEKWPSSPRALWRITLMANTNISDTTDSSFALHNKPFFYYVNDTSTVGDVYTTAIGSDTNLGLFPYEPMLTLEKLLKEEDVQGTDTILLDTGVYVVETNSLFAVRSGDQGSTNKFVVVQGSTNYAAGGTRVHKGVTIADSNLVTVAGTFIELRHLRLVGGGVGLVGLQSACTNIVITNGGISIEGNGAIVQNVRVANGGIGVTGTNITLRQVQLFGGGASMFGANILVEQSIIYATNGSAISLLGDQVALRNNTIVSKGTAFNLIDSTTFATLENNILVADGSISEAFCILRQDGFLLSDYNDLVVRNGAWIGSANGKWEKLGYWQRESLQDSHSMAAEPLFADEAGLDFHLKSKAGRFLNGSFVIDGVHSPAIDAGKPSTAVGLEQAPNGSRINLGAHGGTPEAGKSLTNGWFTLLTANDGGVLKGTNVVLKWNSSSFPTSSTITIQYSPDSGSTWTTIVTGISATNTTYVWNSTLQTSSLTALLRISLVGSTGVTDQTDSLFALRNVPLNFYVNDASTAGDVYTATNGSPAFTGRTPQDPLHSIQAVLTNYDVESLDTIYVDTGLYSITSNIQVIWSDGGDSAGNLLIRGSTNVVTTGTIISRGSQAEGSDGFDVKASGVTLRDMSIRSAYRGVFFDSNRFSSAERLLLYSNVSGVVNFKASSITNRNLRLWSNVNGIEINNARTTVVENCTFVGNSSNAILIVQSFSNVIQNSIFYLSVTGSTALSASSNIQAAAYIDYNIYYFATTNVAIDGLYPSLLDRQRHLAKDFRSNITNPLFENASGGDFHLKSVAGRFQDSVNGFVTDGVNAWGIDHGNPSSSFTNEPQVNGSRVNIGAYGNTEYASKGSTSQVMEIRTANVPTVLSTNDNPLPLIWSSQNSPTTATVRIEYSGDGGLTWTVVATNILVQQEYILWNLTPLYNTYNRGLLRVIGDGGNPFGIGDTNNAPIDLFFGEFAINNGSVNTNAGMIVWRGAWGENYQVQYADMWMTTNQNFAWSNAVDGAADNQKANFQSTIGGDFVYEDPESTGAVRRIYRVLREQYEP